MAAPSTEVSLNSTDGSNISNMTLVLFKSELDRWVTFTFLLIALPLALTANGCAIVMFAVRSKYKRPVHIILVTLCSLDITIVLATLPWKLLVTAFNTIDVLEYAPCQLTIGVSGVAQLCCYHVCTLLAWEQYYFFCRPYVYEARFTVKRTVIFISLIIALTSILMILSLFAESTPWIRSPATLTCHMTYIQTHSATLVFFCYVVVLVCSVAFVSFSIYRLSLSKVSHTPGIATVAQVQRSNPALPAVKIKKSIRVLLMLSGIFVITSIPGHLATNGNHMTWSAEQFYAHFDASDPMTQFVRIANHITHIVSPAIDPFIYLYTHKSLYKARSFE